MLFDAHIHLTDNEYSGYIEHVLTSLRAMKIVACSVTVDSETAFRSFRLFNSHHDIVRQFVGIHPEAAAREDLDKFKEIFDSNLQSIDGVGEIGLDGTYDVPYDRQKQVFGSMLALAESAKKPVSIHSRKALDDVLQMLPSYRIKGALLHWFAGSKKQLAKSMDMGLYVSYGPALVYLEDKQVLLKNTDRNRFLVETDGPVRYSRCFGNLPAVSTGFLVSVVASAARTLGMTYDEAAGLLEQNSKAYLSGGA
ncbi:putative TatD-like deoxyribonuclease [Candidatus Nitrososphaera gargensis Ga9.2]|uniref:Putative TatD-like deoxyribonuclease n=1 Tax=Nitrososphaera gargensis (strain Ga9.2) TaxID=1237085 RepID=K0IIU9_NITGG|nr:TatD family hydrolase [Candidatus Nitrososphaera gargensis]AFU59008.1 putative TatD-like deoxyribonuclease [Candidatus Nitrososphaera gargensis Ga9.2]